MNLHNQHDAVHRFLSTFRDPRSFTIFCNTEQHMLSETIGIDVLVIGLAHVTYDGLLSCLPHYARHGIFVG